MTPTHPFLFLFPATGTPPLHFSAGELPEGLTLDAFSGIISGTVQLEGNYPVRISVKNGEGKVQRTLNIVAGSHKLALTPPMGWNPWNVWAVTISDQKVRDAADWMVKSGLAANGYHYLNIDDGWEGKSGPDGKIQPNEKFPDMKGLANYLHSNGLKLGLYSSPRPKTCAGYEGSWKHEELDATRWAAWGIDYIKYDWCSYEGIFAKPKVRWPHFFRQGHFFVHWSIPLLELKRPYLLMRAALDNCHYDIVYSIVPMTLHRAFNPAA